MFPGNLLRPILLLSAFLLSAFLHVPAMAADRVKVALKTDLGTITIAVEVKRAPITSANFLAYVDQKKLDGTKFYRAARAQGDASRGFIQGGVHRDARRSLLPIAHEPTTRTGIRHVDGTISMARREPGTAMGEFFITVGAAPTMNASGDAKGDRAGYAAFGRVVSGMPVVKRILAVRTWPGGSGSMKGQLIKEPVRIIEARRVS